MSFEEHVDIIFAFPFAPKNKNLLHFHDFQKEEEKKRNRWMS